MPANEVWQAVVAGRLHNQSCINVFHFAPGATTVVDSSPLGVALRTWWLAQPMSQMSNQYNLDEIRTKKLFPTVNDEIITVVPQPAAGTLVGESLPSTVALCLSLRTGLGGRSFRGRKYIAAIPESEQNGSRLITSAKEAWEAIRVSFMDTFGNDPNSSGWHVGVLSRKMIKDGQTVGAAFTDVNNLLVRDVLATMRSRRIGHGH